MHRYEAAHASKKAYLRHVGPLWKLPKSKKCNYGEVAGWGRTDLCRYMSERVEHGLGNRCTLQCSENIMYEVTHTAFAEVVSGVIAFLYYLMAVI